MKLSAKTRYAARILLDLARHEKAEPVPATRLSQHTGVSVQFIEQILKPLKLAGLTQSTRGASGGHSLAKKPADITLADVVHLMEEMGVATGVDIDRTIATGRKVTELIGHPAASYILRAGKSSELIRELPTGQGQNPTKG